MLKSNSKDGLILKFTSATNAIEVYLMNQI